MKVIIAENVSDVARSAADKLLSAISDNPGVTLGLATGATMEPVYEAVVASARGGSPSFARTTTFNLDEYVGLDAGDERSYRATMNRLLFDRLDFSKERTYLPDGRAKDPAAEAYRYEQKIAEFGLFFQMLGIGTNGHIGFNEPGTPVDSKCHVVALTPETRRANAPNFVSPDDVPTHAITMGLATIMSAQKILLVATGAHKAGILAQALQGSIEAAVPASILQRHPDLTVIVDKAAGAMLV